MTANHAEKADLFSENSTIAKMGDGNDFESMKVAVAPVFLSLRL